MSGLSLVVQKLYPTCTDWLNHACLCYTCALPEVSWPVSTIDVTFNIVTSRMCRGPVNGPLDDFMSNKQSTMSCDELPDYQDSSKSVPKLLCALWKLDADKRQLKSETQRILFFPTTFVTTSDDS